MEKQGGCEDRRRDGETGRNVETGREGGTKERRGDRVDAYNIKADRGETRRHRGTEERQIRTEETHIDKGTVRMGGEIGRQR